MSLVISIIESASAALLLLAIWKLGVFVASYVNSPLRDVPGPQSPSLLFGHMKELRGDKADELRQQYLRTYGNTFKYKGWLNRDRLFTVDPRAINHILNHSADYQKPSEARVILGQILGNGLIVVEGEQHRVQRRILNPAFGPSQIRELTEIFLEKAIQLRDLWSSVIAQQGSQATIDITVGMSQMTLDIIALAGFNCSLDALRADVEANELNKAIHEVVKIAGVSPLILLKAIYPPLRIIPDERTTKKAAALAVMRRIGLQLISEKKAAIIKAAESREKDGGDELHGRDLLSLLIKANMSSDILENQRLSDEDVLAQVPTFLVAGHETTSTAVTWCLFALTQAPEIQRKLREELLSVPTDAPSMDELNELPYLDMIVRESMRLYPPVRQSARVAMKDDVIPLSTPYTDVHGQVHDSIMIKKGSPISVPIFVINTSKELWGEDALEFKPERWEAIPEAAHHTPGLWSSLLSFLGGPRACIGYRFSLVEMKAAIFTLVRAFEFDLSVPASDINSTKGTVVQRPFIKGQKDKGTQMPLIVRPYQQV